MSKTITYGICLHQGECFADALMPRFNLKQLEKPLSWGTMSWWNHLRKLIHYHATLLSVIIILIETGRLLIFLCLLAQTSMVHGKQSAQAITYIICCNICRQSRKVIRQMTRQGLPKKPEKLETVRKPCYSKELDVA